MVFYSKWMFISNLTLTLCHYLSDGKRRNVSTNSVSTVNNHHIAHRQSSKHRVAVVSTMCKYFPSLWLCLISVIIILQCMQWDLRRRSVSAREVTANEQTLNPFDREFGIFLNKTETDGHRYITDIWSYIHIVFSFKSLRKCFVVNDWYPKGLLWTIILTTEAGR